MNIQKAKEQIKKAMTAYFTKDEFGGYVIPPERQRPVFLIGPPGIGKTAIMEQIAQEFNVGIVSYSMTHHTRQSALGLPFIEKKTYGGVEYSVSEYTMSEIIASVYDYMEKTGLKEGILFLDEINCVSETLAPAMLQFLQYKTFGRHRVPDGWIVVTAGNPMEYNNSVRDFDIVTWDRLKRIDVEPDFPVWKEYAEKKLTHPSILSYLELNEDNFYKIETKVGGKSFVTARGWCDLSDMIKLFEKNSISVDEDVISQYIQNDTIARDFSVYYDLYNKYKTDYQIENILRGNVSEEIKKKASGAKFDERLSLTGIFMDKVAYDAREIFTAEKYLENISAVLKELQMKLMFPGSSADKVISEKVTDIEGKIRTGKEAGNLSADSEYVMQKTLKFLGDEKNTFSERNPKDGNEAYDILKKDVMSLTKKTGTLSDMLKEKLSNLFKFMDEVYGEGQEITTLLTELTVNYYTSYFISRYGSEDYAKHSETLCFSERQKDILKRIETLGI